MSKQSLALYGLLEQKQYAEVIKKGASFLKSHPEDAGIHLAMMDAHFKMRADDPAHLDGCAESARLAIICGHNTGYAHDRLLKVLKTLGRYHAAVSLCDLVLMPAFAFDAHGGGDKAAFTKAREQLLTLLPKAKDGAEDVLFDKDHIAAIIARQQERLRHEREVNELLNRAGQALERGDMSEHLRLMKLYKQEQKATS